MRVRLISARLLIRELEIDDLDLLARYDERNRPRFERFAPERTLDAFEREQNFAQRLALGDRGQAVTFGVFERSAAGELMGLVGFDAFASGPPIAASISYSIDGRHEGRGFASEAVASAIRYTFDELALARLEATVHPENARSRRLLERQGFVIFHEVLEVPVHVSKFMRPQAAYAVTPETFVPPKLLS